MIKDFESIQDEMSTEEIFSNGKRLYLINSYAEALTFLSKACKLISEESGEMSDNMFESYYYYAKCLYYYGKNQDNLMDDKEDELEETNETKDIDDTIQNKENLSGKNSLETEPKEETTSTPDGNTLDSNDDKKIVDAEIDTNYLKVKEGDEISFNVEAAEDECSNDETNENEEEEIKEDETDEQNQDDDIKNEEDVTYFRLAYENIACAKVILMRQLNENKSNKAELELKLADCCDIAGHTYVEDSNCEAAIQEYEEALKLRKQNKSMRLVAESHLNMSQALTLIYKWSDSEEHLLKCQAIFEAMLSESDTDEEKSDYSEILKNLEEKLTDVKDARVEFEKAKASLRETMSSALATVTASFTNAEKPVNDINSLVRRKKKQSDDSKLEQEQMDTVETEDDKKRKISSSDDPEIETKKRKL